MKKNRSFCFACAVFIGLLAAAASAADAVYDALGPARKQATAENQRVLLLLAGGDPEAGAALEAAMADYRGLGKLLKYEYRLAAIPAESEAGLAIRKRLSLTELALPALAVLSTEDDVLGSLGANQLMDGEAIAKDRIRAFLESHQCDPVDARDVLRRGLAEAAESKRHAFLYLSAPW